MKRLLLLAGVFLLALAPASKARADAEQEVDSALNASLKWVGQIDSGAYDDCYMSGSNAFHEKVPQDQWDNILKALRTPLGAVTSRKQISHIFKPNGFEGTAGEFMVITYDTEFKKLPNATEVVVLRWEGGKWRGAGSRP